MDDVVFSRILLCSDYETFITLGKTCKKLNRIAKIMWKNWLSKNLKKDKYNIFFKSRKEPLGFCEYSYFYKKYKKIRHGKFEYKLEKFSLGTSLHCTTFSIPYLAGIVDKAILNYSHGKLNGRNYYFKKNFLFKICTYKNGYLHGPMYLIRKGKCKQIRIYENGKKCCSLKNSFCYKHQEEGFKYFLMFKNIR
jgi:hypothetical protein